MDEIKVGSVIQLSEQEREGLESLNEFRNKAYAAFSTASQMLLQAEEGVINFIREARPELEGFEFGVKYETGRVRIVSKSRDIK